MKQVTNMCCAVIAGLMIVCPPLWLRAQLIDCSMSGSAEEYKIYVDDVNVPPGVEVPKVLLKRANLLRDTFLRDLNVTLQDQASAKRCLGRKPREKSEYNDAQINSLDNLRVVMEVWGAIENQSTGEGEFGFVLVPTRSIAPPAVFVVKDNFNGKLDSILKRNKQRQAFAPVVLGTRYYQNHKYLDALPLLCQGRTQLQVMISEPGSDSQLVQRGKNLIAKLDGVIDDSYRQAKASGEPQFAALTPDENDRYSCPK